MWESAESAGLTSTWLSHKHVGSTREGAGTQAQQLWKPADVGGQALACASPVHTVVRARLGALTPPGCGWACRAA